MGEYYVLVNTDRKEYINPIDFDEPIKLGGLMRTQFTGVFPYLLAMTTYEPDGELHYFGSWAGDSVSVVGDTQPLYDDVTTHDEYKKLDADRLAVEYNYFARQQLLRTDSETPEDTT